MFYDTPIPDAKVLVRAVLMLPALWVLQALITLREEPCLVGVAACETERLVSDCFGVVPDRTLNSSISGYSGIITFSHFRE